MRFLALPLAAAAALGLAACGPTATTSAKFKGDAKAVAQVVADLQQAGERRKPDDICNNLLAQPLQDRVSATGTSCGAEMKKAIQDADTYKLDVQSVAVTGTTATAVVKASDQGKAVLRTFKFAKDAKGWRITDLGGG